MVTPNNDNSDADEILSDHIENIIAFREPLSTKAMKIYQTISGAGGFLETFNSTFSRAIGIKSTGNDEFLRYIDECIEKDYVRVILKDNPKKKNGFFTFEYFYRVVLENFRQQNSEVYLSHKLYIEDKIRAIQSETEPH